MTVLLSFLALLALGAASNITDTHTVCNYLYKKYPQYFAWDTLGPDALETVYNASVYTEINTVYWNFQNSFNRAACAFFPATAEQVSDAVQMLNNYTSVQYALKSGGHQPAPGFSSTDGGVMISFEPNLASTVRAEDGEHFIVGAGARWGDAYLVAEETNQVIVGGRLGHIGVGGFILGGGLSYYSAQYVSHTCCSRLALLIALPGLRLRQRRQLRSRPRGWHRDQRQQDFQRGPVVRATWRR